MRLRRENGDFDFTIADGAATISAKLFPEQLIGQIAFIGDEITTVINVDGASGDTTYTLAMGNGDSYTYTVATGAVAVVGG